MATFRTLSPALWSDPFIEGLPAQEKLLYIYLFTNEHVNNVGYMQATLRKISFETAVPQDAVAAFLEKTDKLGKTVRDGDSILCLNFVRHQTTKSPKVALNLCKVFNLVGSAKIRRALLERYPDIFKSADTIPDPLPDGSDTVSIPYQDGTDTVGKQLQDRAVQGKAKKDPEHTHDGSHGSCEPLDLSGACVSPAPLNGEDVAERQDVAQEQRRRGDYEFSLVREAYDNARQEGQLSGRQEFLTLYNSPAYPGHEEIIASINLLCEQDDQFRRGFAPSLAKFLTQRMWTMKPRAPVGHGEQQETADEKARRESFLARQKAYLDDLKARKEAAKRK